MTAAEFVKQYCEKAGWTEKEFYESQVPMPDSASPSGWAAVTNSPTHIKAHVDLYMSMPLAGTASEPVAWRENSTGRCVSSILYQDGSSPLCHGYEPLYAAPPAPVAVPDEKESICGSVFGEYYCDGWNACRAAVLNAGPVTAATVPDGWKLVPVEPTEAMLDAAYSHPASTEDRMRKQYASMLAAAPAASEQDV